MLDLQEFRLSAIPDDLALANIAWVDGDEAVELLSSEAIAQAQKVNSYITSSGAKIRDRYQFASAGGWVASGCNLDGSAANVPYFKPAKPRQAKKARGFGGPPKSKVIKYETPAKCPALPLLPWVTWGIGYRTAKRFGKEKQYVERFHQSCNQSSIQISREEAATILTQESWAKSEGAGKRDRTDREGFERNCDAEWNTNYSANNAWRAAVDHAKRQADVEYWQWIRQVICLSITIVEGLKKALSLIAQGIPAIAIRGITQWRTTGTDELHPILAQFATEGRKVYIAFDQDEKLKTRLMVRKQAIKLGEALEKQGCKPLYFQWDGALGKGIDDVLYGLGEDASTWLKAALLDARTLKQYRRDGMTAAALATIRRLSASAFPIERFTDGEYLPELPELQRGVIHVVNANMNAGKTTRIGRDWVTEAKQRGWLTLVLAPLNSLGKQTAEEWELPHIHDFGTSSEQQRALWGLVKHSGGLVMCPDSLHRLPEWFLDYPIQLVLDEGNHVVSHMVNGATLGPRWADILDRFGTIAQHAAQTGAIVLSEDGLPDRAINFVQQVSGAASVRVFRHFKHGVAWDCSVMTGQVSGFRARLLQVARRGDRLLFVSTSQQECRRLERVLGKVTPNLNVVRIDSQTNQRGAFNSFFLKPDKWIETNQPDVLILSPSVKSGVSIEGNLSTEDAYFQSVWGYFPSLDTDSQMQLLGRYRPAVSRFIFVPPFIRGNGEESLYNPRAIMRRLQQNAAALGHVYGVASLMDDERSDRHLATESAVLEYIASAWAISGAQKVIAFDALVDRLQSAGHSITLAKLGQDDSASQQWKQTTAELWREDAQEGASAAVDREVHTMDWAKRIYSALESTHEDRVIASKVLLRDEFPGMDFDDSEEWYEAIHRDYGAMRRGVRLQAKAENLPGAKEQDRSAVTSVMGASIRAFHRLPKHFARAAALQKTGVLALLDGKPYSNHDPRAIAIKKAALRFAKEISYWLRLTINPEQTPVEICNKLLGKLDLRTDKKDRPGEIKASRPGRRGEQNSRVYHVEIDPNSVRARLLEAARRKLSESVSTICNTVESPHIQIVDTTSEPPPYIGKRVKWGTSLSVWVVESTEGDRAYLRNTLNGYRPLASVQIAELMEVAS